MACGTLLAAQAVSPCFLSGKKVNLFVENTNQSNYSPILLLPNDHVKSTHDILLYSLTAKTAHFAPQFSLKTCGDVNTCLML